MPVCSWRRSFGIICHPCCGDKDDSILERRGWSPSAGRSTPINLMASHPPCRDRSENAGKPGIIFSIIYLCYVLGLGDTGAHSLHTGQYFLFGRKRFINCYPQPILQQQCDQQSAPCRLLFVVRSCVGPQRGASFSQFIPCFRQGMSNPAPPFLHYSKDSVLCIWYCTQHNTVHKYSIICHFVHVRAKRASPRWWGWESAEKWYVKLSSARVLVTELWMAIEWHIVGHMRAQAGTSYSMRFA